MHPLTKTLIDRSPAPIRGPVTGAVRTVDGAIADRLPGLAAEIAFWILLSLPSLALTAIAAAGLFVDGQQFQDQLVARVTEVASVALTFQTIDAVVVPVVEQLIEGGGVGLVSFGFLTAVWTASRAVRTVLTTIAIVSDRVDRRRGWVDRLLGFGVTLGTLVVGSVLAPLLIAGPNFGEQLVDWLGADLDFVANVWRVAYWPAVILIATIALAVLYHLGIPGESRWRHDWPGAVLATAVWLAGSAGLRFYGFWVADGDSVYGPLAGPIVVLLWLWLTGFAVLLGAELNAQIERLAPDVNEPVLNAPPATEGDDGAAAGAAAPSDTEVAATRLLEPHDPASVTNPGPEPRVRRS